MRKWWRRTRKSLVSLVASRRPWVQKTLVTALASGVAWEVGDRVVANGGLVAAIAAALSVRISLHKSVREGFGQIFGTAIGAGTALLSTTLLGFGFFTVLGTVVLCAIISRAIHLGEIASFNVPITALIVIGPGLSESNAIRRMSCTLIGVGTAIVFSYFAHPKTPAGRTIDQIGRVGRRASELLDQMSAGVAHGYTQQEAGDWLAKARLLVEEIPGVRSQAQEARSYAKWFPTAELDEAEDLYSRGVAAEHTVVQIRSIARTLFDTSVDDAGMSDATAQQIARALSSASAAIKDRMKSLSGDDSARDKEEIADELRAVGSAFVDEVIDQVDETDPDQLARTISLKANIDIIADSLDLSSPAIRNVASPTSSDGILAISPITQGRRFRRKIKNVMPQFLKKYF
ncbi:MAG: hypothetical protein EBU43_04880 [Actinobacteria bacterium]|nr:hypothetical protein [Actinomycetota bacterium]